MRCRGCRRIDDPDDPVSSLLATESYFVNQGTSGFGKIETFPKGVYVEMKTLCLILGASFLVFGTAPSRAADLDRISAATGVPVGTLQAERASTGLGWGGIEKAHLLSNATGQSFDNIVALHRLGQGWGKIAHNNGLNLGKLVSNANRSAKATAHTRNTRTVHDKNSGVHGKSAAHMGRGHNNRMTRAQGVNHGSRFRSANTGFHGMHGMSHGMSGVGHGGRGR